MWKKEERVELLPCKQYNSQEAPEGLVPIMVRSLMLVPPLRQIIRPSLSNSSHSDLPATAKAQ